MSHSEIQDVGIRMLFVGVRRSLSRIAADVGLMVDMAWKAAVPGQGVRLSGGPARGKWWPLTRNSGGVSDALGSV